MFLGGTWLFFNQTRLIKTFRAIVTGLFFCEWNSWRKTERREDRGALPSKGVRLEPPFFPSSPCCEYCFRRFWALRMVPGPIDKQKESRGVGRGRQRGPDSQETREGRRRKDRRARKWVLKSRQHIPPPQDGQQRYLWRGGSSPPPQLHNRTTRWKTN